MKRYLSIVAIVFISSIISCKKLYEKPPYDQSLSVWQSFKQKSHNSYTYDIYTRTPTVIGTYTETIITVNNGVVTARDYMVYTLSTGGVQQFSEQYHEDAANLGSHTAGAAAIMLDAIYDEVGGWLKSDSAKYSSYFAAGSDGLINYADLRPLSCQSDDCDTHLQIIAITAL